MKIGMVGVMDDTRVKGPKTYDNGRSIPDRDLEVIDAVWGKDIPEVQKAVQRLWGVPVADMQAMRLERIVATQVQKHTMDGMTGAALSAEAARILLNLAPCVETGPYGIGYEWVDIADAAKMLGLSAAHIRRMLINDKISLTMIRRPSSGIAAKKRWIRVSDLTR